MSKAKEGKKVVVKDDRTVFEKQEDAWFENDCEGSIENYET